MRNVPRMARYMLMQAARGNRDGEYGKDPRGGYTSYEYPRGEYPQMGMNYEPEGRFRDRRGRERYDDGRFAPRSGYGPENRRENGAERGEYIEPPRLPKGGDGGKNRVGNEGGRCAHYDGDDGDEGRKMTLIGFGDRGEMEHRGSEPQRGGAHGDERELTPEMAREWVKRMHNEDGTSGEHWTMDQVKKLMATKGVQYDPAQMYAIINAVYSDYCKVFKKHGITSPDVYFDLAVAWLNDKDAVKDKAAAYYECIVKH